MPLYITYRYTRCEAHRGQSPFFSTVSYTARMFKFFWMAEAQTTSFILASCITGTYQLFTLLPSVLGSTCKFLSSNEQVQDVPIQICGHTILVTMFVVPNAATYVVIGADWLKTLCPHVTDYSTSTIKFILNDDFITLTGYRGFSATTAKCHQLNRFACTDAIAEFYLLNAQEAEPHACETPTNVPDSHY